VSNGLPLFPPQASTMAGRVDALYLFLTAASGLICLGIFGAMLLFIVRYRRRPGNELARASSHTLPIEITWTVVPLGLSMIPFFWSASIYLDMGRPPADALEIYVVARQWMWKAEHPEGQSEIDELHVPVGRAVKLTMISQDVIHSFYVPDFRVKADVLPGRYTSLWFEATEPGEHALFCAEYCGTEHSRMTGRVIAMEPAAYAAWLEGGPTQSPAQQGRKLFEQLGCIACHEAGLAPNLQGLFGQPVRLSDGQTTTADESYIRESILNPNAKVAAGYQPIMPSFAGRVSDEQILQLIAYIKSIGPQPGGQSPNPQASPAPSPLASPLPAPSPPTLPSPARSPTP
jgi:cytochrome c oxidase subunit 2